MCVILYEYLASMVSDLPSLEFQWLWILGTKPKPSAIAVSALNCWIPLKFVCSMSIYFTSICMFLGCLDSSYHNKLMHSLWTFRNYTFLYLLIYKLNLFFTKNNAICVLWLTSSRCLQTLLFQCTSCHDQIAYQTVVHSLLWLSAFFLGPSPIPY